MRIPKGLDRRAFLAGLVAAPAVWPSEARARLILNQLTGFAGRPPSPGAPASVTFIASQGNQTSSTTQTWSNFAIGATDPQRTTPIAFACRTDTATPPACTIGGISAPVIVSGLPFSGSAHIMVIYAAFTGAGTALENDTTATIVFSHGVAIQRHGFGSYRALNLSTPTTAQDTDVSTGDVPTQTGQMSLDLWEDGIAIAMGMTGNDAGTTWQSPLTHSFNNVQLEDRFGGHLDAASTVAGQTLQWSPGNTFNAQRGAVSASWRGQSNP